MSYQVTGMSLHVTSYLFTSLSSHSCNVTSHHVISFKTVELLYVMGYVVMSCHMSCWVTGTCTTVPCHVLLLSCERALLQGNLNLIMWGAGMAQWWSRSPPTNVAWVRILDPVSQVGWVYCWFSSLLQGFFSWFSSFPPSIKINISKFQFDLEF